MFQNYYIKGSSHLATYSNMQCSEIIGNYMVSILKRSLEITILFHGDHSYDRVVNVLEFLVNFGSGHSFVEFYHFCSFLSRSA